MRKIKNFFKRYWNKAVALFCALAIATTTTVTSFVYAAIGDENVEWTDLVRDIAGFVPLVGTVLDFADLCYDVYVYFFVTKPYDPYEWTTNKEVILAAWKTITDNSPMTEDQFADYWQKCIDELGIADDRLIMIEETVRLGFTLSDVIQYCYHSDGDGVSVSDSGDVQITGKKFKQMVDYWGQYYMPKNTSSRLSWQTDVLSTNNPQQLGFFQEGSFAYNTDWHECYFIPFYYSGTSDNKYYYSQFQYHFYQKVDKSEDGSNIISLYVDVWNWYDNTEPSSFLITDKLATYRFGRWDFFYYHNTFSFFPLKSDYINASNVLSPRVSLPDSSDLYDFTDSSLSSTIASSNVINFNRILGQKATPESIVTANHADYGFYVSDSAINMGDYGIDTSKIPDDYVITPNGDTFYDYTITNTTGDTTTINKYVTNNYYIPETDKKDDDQGGSSGGSSGDVTVSGDVNVKGDIDVSGKVDINVNVSQGSSESAGDYIDPGEIDADLDGYLSHVPDVSKDFIDYLKDFFGWLPKEIYGLLVLGLVVAIFCRLNGR